MPYLTVFAWLGVLALSLTALVVASQRAIKHAEALVFGTRLPPFLIGITLVAVGTDLPEIANSIVASIAGHGDINVGDSVGSAATQATLVLGLLPWLGGSMEVSRKRVLVVCGACATALAIGGYLVSDGYLARPDAALLVAGWIIGSFVIWKGTGPIAEPALPVPAQKPASHALALFGALIGVTLAASLLVYAFVGLAELVGLPEYILTFFVASIGTSLPELFVDVAALRHGLKDLALGDILGSSFVDATLSLGIGPLLAPTLVNGPLALRGALTSAAAVALACVILLAGRKHGKLSGTALLAVYAGLYIAILK